MTDGGEFDDRAPAHPRQLTWRHHGRYLVCCFVLAGLVAVGLIYAIELSVGYKAAGPWLQLGLAALLWPVRPWRASSYSTGWYAIIVAMLMPVPVFLLIALHPDASRRAMIASSAVLALALVWGRWWLASRDANDAMS